MLSDKNKCNGAGCEYVKNELWIDGGHNGDASIQLKKSMSFINNTSSKFLRVKIPRIFTH